LNTIKCQFGDAETPGASLTLQIYKTIAPSTKSAQTNLHSLTNLPLTTTSRNLDALTGKVLEDDDINTYLEVLSRRAYMARKELNDAKRLGMAAEASLKILYFVDSRALRPEDNCVSPYFLTPDDKSVKGSAQMFYALLHELMSKQLLAVASFMLNSISKPKLVALLPQKEVVDDEDGQQMLPAGLNMISLPFLSEMRLSHPPEHVLNARASVTDEMIEAAVGLIKTWPAEETRNVEDFEASYFVTSLNIILVCILTIFVFLFKKNPSLQCFFAGLQAIALSQASTDWVASRDDQMQPHITAGIVSSALDFKSVVRIADEDASFGEKKKSTTKSVAVSAATSGINFIILQRNHDDDFKLLCFHYIGGRKKTRSEFEASSPPEDYSRCTVADLKEICKSKGLKVAGTKADLIARLEES